MKAQGDEDKEFCLFDAAQFRGKVVLITGAGKGPGPGGIGYNAAMLFGRAGARLAIIGRTEEKVLATARDLEAAGATVLHAVGDVSDEAALDNLFGRIERDFGRLDIVINNAGLSGEVRALARMSSKAFRYAFNVHLHTMASTRMAAALMRRHKIAGTIINIGTYFTSPHRQITRPYPFRTPYTGAQAWKLEHTRVSAWELGRDGIRVMAVNFGPVEGGRIDTIVYPLGALERGLWGREVSGDDIRRKTVEMHPAGRFLTQDEIARAIIAVASRELREAANGSVVELAAGLDYRVPPQSAPPLLAGPPPDLAGRRILMTGRPGAEQASACALAFAASGARVILATPDATRLLSDLAAGRAPEAYGDGQRRILGNLTARDLDPHDEAAITSLFDELTTTEPGDNLDAILIMTGDAEASTGFNEMPPEEHERIKERFAFEPTVLMRHALAAMLLQGNRRAGLDDARFLSLRPFLGLLERQRGVPGRGTAVQRIHGGWTPEEEKLLQTGARAGRGGIVVVGPATGRDGAEEANVAAVVRASLQSIVTSVAAETASARAAIRVNAIFPGADAVQPDASRTARAALCLAADGDASISGMIYHPDERGAALPQDGPLAGRTAVVTGGGRNLGQAIAFRLARDGASVVLAGRGQTDLDLTARAIRSLGGEAATVAADIAFPGEREKIVRAARAMIEGRGGRRDGARAGSGAPAGVDLWVNNAGIGGAFAALPEIELDGEARWHQALAVNFTGAWLGMVQAVLDMRRRRAPGGVVNVSTFYADQPYVFRIPYTVPKVLLRRSARLLADALRPHGISISDIEPSLIDGPRFQWVARNYGEHFKRHGIEDPSADPAVAEWFRALVPGVAPQPSDVADAVAFAARRGLTGSGQELAVSTLPIGGRAVPGGRERVRPGRTAVIVTTGRSIPEIDRAGLLAAWCLESGSERVILAGDDGMLTRLNRRLSRGASGSPWWNLPLASPARGTLEIRGVDAISAGAVADLFADLEAVDTVIHAPGDPGRGERFVMFPADADVAGLDEERLRALYREHQRALSLFVERQVTASLIVARQAARALAPGGALLVSRRRPRTPEAALACEAERQLVRTAAAEFRLLGKPLSASFTHAAPRLRLGQPAVQEAATA